MAILLRPPSGEPLCKLLRLYLSGIFSVAMLFPITLLLLLPQPDGVGAMWEPCGCIVDGSPPGWVADYEPEHDGVAGDTKEQEPMVSRGGKRQVESDGGATMKRIFWNAMMVGRTAALTLGVAVMLALVLGAGTTAVAATGVISCSARPTPPVR